MTTRKELLATLETKVAAIEAAQNTHLVPLRAQMVTLRADIEAAEKTCGCGTLTKVQDKKYQCTNEDCEKVFEFSP